ncbi:MAG: PD-(D/E)XK nuclease family protein, partial [Treponema sp.]|nr:PD-(D/E)XK nuclease family protein [Treponema sp.]
MNHAEAALYNNIDTPNVLFVFPTDIAVSRWADHLLRLRGGGTIAMNKFMAWDKFKQSAVKSKVQDKKSIPSSLRKIYVSSFIKENADAVRQNKEPLFSSLIKTQWAGQSAQFVPWLTGILPQLGSWFNKKTNTSIDKILDTETDKLTSRFEDDDKDLYTLTSRYALFMKEYSLFEPAWETPPFNDNGMKCFIFFPEALSDFREYRELLTTANNVTLISASSAGCENTKPFNTDTFYYTNSRSEITEASLFIRQLHEKHDIDWDSVVVCIPDSENYEPYVMREFANRNIPFVKRMGKPLADYPAGRFFQSVFECKTNVFSFTSVVALLMNNNLPWKHPELNSALIDFGIANNCLYSWTETEPKKQINIWEDAFTNPVDDPSNEVKNYFFKLKKHLTSLHSCLTFAELRISYFSFREIFFLDIDKCSDETNLIMARCVAELTDLIQLEKDFPKAVLVDPLLFIAEHLKETNYLAQSKTGGVTILPYKTAASVPYDYHIILGAQHEILSVVYTSLSFLPEKKREELGIKDEDASDAFINLHKFNSQKRSAFFCSEQTFSGYSIPHSKINAPLSPKNRRANDPEYKDFFSHDHYKQESEFCANETDTLEFVHEKQIDGFLEWKNRRENIFSQNKKTGINEDIYKYDNTKNYIDSIFRKPDKTALLAKPTLPRVSPTSMQDWYNCSLYWLFKRVFKLQNTRIETCLMDNIAGSVYHAVLNQFF